MEKHTKAIVCAVLIGSLIIALTVAVIGRYQITGGPNGFSQGAVYVVRDSWTGRSWFEQVRKY